MKKAFLFTFMTLFICLSGWAEGEEDNDVGKLPFTITLSCEKTDQAIKAIFILTPSDGVSKIEAVESSESKVTLKKIDSETEHEGTLKPEGTAGTSVSITFDEIEAGDYVLTIPKEAIKAYNNEDEIDLEDYVLPYTIEAQEIPQRPEYSLVVSPESESEVEAINTVTLAFSPKEGADFVVTVSDNGKAMLKVPDHDAPGAMSVTDKTVTIDFGETFTAAGEYVLTIPKDAIKVNGVDFADNDTVFKYNIKETVIETIDVVPNDNIDLKWDRSDEKEIKITTSSAEWDYKIKYDGNYNDENGWLSVDTLNNTATIKAKSENEGNEKRTAHVKFFVKDKEDVFKEISVTQKAKIIINIKKKGAETGEQLKELHFFGNVPQTLEVETNADGGWKINPSPVAWVEINSTGSAGKTDINLSVKENPYSEPRDTKLTFYAILDGKALDEFGNIVEFEDKNAVKFELSVKQDGNGTEPYLKIEGVYNNTINFTADEEVKTITIETNSSSGWEVSSVKDDKNEEPEWLKINPRNGKEESTKVSISVSQNPDTGIRTAKVTFEYGSENPLDLTIIQAGKKEEGDVSITVSPKDGYFDSNGGTIDFTIDTKAESWEAIVDYKTVDNGWLTVSDPKDNKGTATITATENNTYSDRTGTITFYATDGEKRYGENSKDVITITQKAKAEPEPSILLSTNQLDFKSEGNEKQPVDVIATGSWCIKGIPEWVTVEPYEPNIRQEGNKTVYIGVVDNNSTLERTSTIIFYVPDPENDNDVMIKGGVELKYELTIKQDGKKTIDPIPDVTITPSHNYIYDNETQTVDFTVSGETEESIRKDYSWYWNDDKGTRDRKPYIFKPTKVDTSNNPEGYEKQSVTLSIHRLPGGPFKEPVPQAEFIVYPEPQLQFIVDGEKKDNLNVTYSKKKTETLKIEVVSNGGSSDWTYEWKEGNASLSSKKEFTVGYDNDKERTITLTVTNKLPEQGKEWKKEYTFTVSFTDIAMPTITLAKVPDVKQMFSGKSIDISFELSSTDESVSTDKNDYTWDWMVDGQTSSTDEKFHFTPKTEVSSGSEKQTVSLAITRNADGEKKTESLSFDVFPEPVLYFTQLNVGFEEELVKEVNESAVMEQNVIWQLQVKPTKGNNDPSKWEYTWTEDGETFSDASGQNCRIGYDGKEKRTVKLVVKNTLPGEDVEATTGQWEHEYTFTARFKGDMPPIELSGKVNGKEAPDNILAGTEVTVDFKLKDVDNTIINDPGKDYTWRWNDEDYTNDKLTYAFITSNNLKEDSKKNDVKLTLKRTKDEKETDETISFTVWPLPVVSLSWNEGEIKSLTETTPTQTLRVTPTGGYRGGWSVEWTDDKGRVVGNGNEITLNYDDYKARKDEPTPILFTVSVTNQAEGHNTPWYEKSFNFYIKLTGDVTTTIQAVPNEFNDNYLSNDRITLSHTSSVENLKNVKWTVDDNATVEGTDLIFGDVKEKTDVTVTFSADGAPSVQKVFTVWPEPQLEETNWEMAFTDTSNKNNNMAKTGSVREGNVIELADIPTLTGGYEDESYVFARLKDSHTELGLNEKGQWTVNGLTFKNGVCKVVIEYVGQTDYSNKQPMGERVLASYPITVYQKPSAPSSLALKGNGNSGTWYVEFDKKQADLVFGKDNSDINIDAYDENGKWIISKATQGIAPDTWNSYYVYNKRGYDNNVVITSDKRHPDRLEEWDGSTYGIVAPDVQEAPQQVVAGQFNINGMQTNGLVRGLNIIRMEDGTVKKVFKK